MERRFAAAAVLCGPEYHPIPKSSTRSSGVPQARQMTARQSPQTNGSATGFSQVGQ
ncbi:MAG TPA: hypothetical protein VHW09_23385 [Bryobacteraceae bacterium]|nr:hypothetical protein [Bryobacteraceae bacterium]